MDGFLVMDLQGRFLDVNEAYCRLTGYDRSELLAMGIRDLEAVESPEETARPIRQVAGTGADRFETAHRCKDGSIVNVEVSTNFLQINGGRFFIFVRDITERKRAETELRQERAQLLSILDALNQGVYIADPLTYEILYANQALRDKFGRQLVGGKCYRELQGMESPCRFCTNALILKNRDQPHYWEHHNPLLAKDFMVMDRIITWPDGRKVRLEVATDVTERKKFEEESHKARRFDAVGLLASGIAHDFNNVLTIIAGNLALARGDLRDHNSPAERLDEIEKASQQARRLIDQLSTLAEGGEPNKQVVSIAQLLRESVECAFSGSRIRCEFSIDHDLFLVEVDERQFSQVINNLVVNAVQAMPGGGRVWVGADNLTVRSGEFAPLKPGLYVRISIRDEGMGIPAGDLHQIFYPYFTTKEKGSGLGLATCYSVVKKHRGFITVESEVGVGTVFCVYFPALSRTVP